MLGKRNLLAFDDCCDVHEEHPLICYFCFDHCYCYCGGVCVCV